MQKVKQVYIFTNGMVMVFGEDGQQVTELQGRFANKAEEISRRLDPDTKVCFAEWKGGVLRNMTKEDFDRLWRKEDEIVLQGEVKE